MSAKRDAVEYWVEHTDTDANVIHFYGPLTKKAAAKKANHLNRIGHKADVLELPKHTEIIHVR